MQLEADDEIIGFFQSKVYCCFANKDKQFNFKPKEEGKWKRQRMREVRGCEAA